MKNKVLATLLVGLIARVELASFAGHPFDLSLFAYSNRLYYETGQFDFLFPALPALYYVQLAFYSLYVLVRDLGVPDLIFMYHTNFILEGIFLRIPLILSDVGIFLLIFRFTGKVRYAAFYLLNPFIIYLTGAWGTYDSLMMLPLVSGFIWFARAKEDWRAFPLPSLVWSNCLGSFPSVSSPCRISHKNALRSLHFKQGQQSDLPSSVLPLTLGQACRISMWVSCSVFWALVGRRLAPTTLLPRYRGFGSPVLPLSYSLD